MKGGIGGGGWVHLKGADNMAVSGLSFRNTLVGSGWAMFCPPMYEQVEKRVLTLHAAHFRQGSFFSSLDERLPAESHDYCKLVNGWE